MTAHERAQLDGQVAGHPETLVSDRSADDRCLDGGQADPDLRLSTATAGAVAQICRRLDGIPLALELAAARTRALPLDRIVTELDDRFRLLTAGSRTATARHRNLLASVEWSHDLLDGATAAGLPVGLQLAGRPFDEETVLRAVHSYESTRRC